MNRRADGAGAWMAAALLSAAALAAAPSGAAPVGDAAFEAKLREAEANIRTSEGALYDGAMARAFDAAEVRAALGRCMDAHPGPRAVRGYFTVLGVDAYQLELRPEGPFAGCVERALEGRRGLPMPPRTPWLNPFQLTVEAG